MTSAAGAGWELFHTATWPIPSGLAAVTLADGGVLPAVWANHAGFLKAIEVGRKPRCS